MDTGQNHPGWATSVPPEDPTITYVGSGFSCMGQTPTDIDHAEQITWPQLPGYEFPSEINPAALTAQPWNPLWPCVRENFDTPLEPQSQPFVPDTCEQVEWPLRTALGLSHDPQALSHARSDSGYSSGIYAQFSGLDNLKSHPETGPSQSECHNDGRTLNDASSTATQDRGESIQSTGFPCSYCDHVARTKSDLKKHERRHTKPFVCDEPGCGWRFATPNDLERHRKSCHNKVPRRGPQEVWKCFGQGCGREGKIWKRWDNFKDHLKRKHPDEFEVLKAKSLEWYMAQSEQGQAESMPGTAMTSQSATLNQPATQNQGSRLLGVQTLPRQRTRAAPKRSGKYKCSECNSTFTRECELRKHNMRHTKPYGCTYPGCYKDFGSKADWKRHEVTQHFQPESYRCSLPRERHPECALVFRKAVDFEFHLQQIHRYQLRASNNDLIKQHQKTNMIGQNYQGQFWCGFCRKIVSLEGSSGADAWKKRFDHIDFEHINPRDGREPAKMTSWLPMSGHITRGVLQRRAHMRSITLGQSSGDWSRFKAEDENAIECESCYERESDHNNEVATSSHSSTMKSSLSPTQTYEEQKLSMFCCQCLHGPWNSLVTRHCQNCSHLLCSSCTPGSAAWSF